MRIAYYSPLRPQPSGISDYSEDLLLELAKRAEVVLMTDGFEPASPAIRGRFEVRDFNSAQPDGCDVCLYHMGNNAAFHAGIYRCLCDRPGVVVLHDWVLHNFFAGLTIRRGDTKAYLKEMEYNYGTLGHTLAQAFFRSGVPPVWEVSPLRFPLNRRVVERSLGIIAHSRFVADRVRRANALVPLARIPHGMAVEPPRRARREDYHLPPETPFVGTFGHVNQCKRLEVVAEALNRVHRRVRFNFLVVGSIADDYDAHRVIDEAGIRPITHFRSPATLDGFKDLIGLCDVAVNLRYPTLGETSGAVLRLLAAGRPTIVSDVGWFSELPDDCVAKVPPNGGAEVNLVAAYVERLLSEPDGGLRDRMGRNARALIAAEHAWSGVAERYIEFLARVIRSGPRHIRADEVIREVAWELSDMGLSADDEWLVPEVAGELAALCEPVPGPGREVDA